MNQYTDQTFENLRTLPLQSKLGHHRLMESLDRELATWYESPIVSHRASDPGDGLAGARCGTGPGACGRDKCGARLGSGEMVLGVRHGSHLMR